MSIFSSIKSEIKDQYLEDDGNKPWIVAFSGGKDSTILLQLVWEVITSLNQNERKRKLYVICNNTLVENPTILDYVEKVLVKIQKKSDELNLNITVDQTVPHVQDSFWVNLIGKGYPAPNNAFRWCTERLKIRPTTKYILNKVSDYGEVILLLGTRKDESASRKKRIEQNEVKNSRLTNHQIANAKSFSPIKELKTKEVWQYLLINKSPWDADNKKLVNLYNNASGGDCPLITDIKTPSCGNSRFGCWVCTVVAKDKSMEGLIEYGEDWMLPLLKIRDFLSHTIDRESENYEEIANKYRMPVRRSGLNGILDGKNIGPYWPWVRAKILKQILEAQKIINVDNSDQQLITYQELAAIHITWQRDFIFDFSVSEIYNEVFNKKIDFKENDNSEFDTLVNVFGKDTKQFNLVKNLLKAQKNKVLLVNKRGLQNDIESLLDEYVNPKFSNVYKENRDK